MKVSLFNAALLVTAASAGVIDLADRHGEITVDDFPQVDLEVADERFGDVIFRGTAEFIYHEMAALKPELFSEPEGLTSRKVNHIGPNNAVMSDGRILDCIARGMGLVRNSSCGEGREYLAKLGGAKCRVAAAYACSRVSCSWNCAIHLCSTNEMPYWCTCESIAQDVQLIRETCLTTPYLDPRVRGWVDRDDYSFVTLGKDRRGC